VAAAFARQVAEIEAGLRAPVVLVGNLDARRDFTDVRDIVRAYELACLTGEAGAAYNIGRGTAVPIRSLLDQLIALSRVPVEIRVDPDRLRPSDAPLLVCDPRRFRELSGWEPEIPLSVSLTDMLNDWRERTAAEPSDPAGAIPGEHA
jgi:GDP-4-dehydro-6-deoxy-D-mannose reductase